MNIVSRKVLAKFSYCLDGLTAVEYNPDNPDLNVAKVREDHAPGLEAAGLIGREPVENKNAGDAPETGNVVRDSVQPKIEDGPQPVNNPQAASVKDHVTATSDNAAAAIASTEQNKAAASETGNGVSSGQSNTVDEHKFAATEIPDNWETLSWGQYRSLASSVSETPVNDKEEATKAIQAELDRRDAWKKAHQG